MLSSPAVKSGPKTNFGRVAFWSLFLALYILGSCFLLFYPLSISPGSQLPDDGDALQTAWMMAWVAHRLPEEPTNLFDANVYFPHPRGLTYSEHFIPQGILVGVLMALGANLVLAYNLLAVGILVAIGISVFLLARELGAGTAGSVAASVVASLCTFNLEEVARLHILFMPGIPLGLMFLVRFFRTGSWRSSVGFGLSFVLQGFASHYYLISLPLFLAPFGLMLLYWYPERRRASELGKLALPVAILSLLFLPVELVYLDTFRSYRFVQALPEGTDLARYVLPPFNSLLYGWFETRAELSGANEHFLGFTALALAAIGLVSSQRMDRENRRLLRCLTVLGVLFVFLSAGAYTFVGGRYFGPGLYHLLYDYVPFFNLARVPERLSVYFSMTFALLVGVGVSRVTAKLSSKSLWILSALFLILVPLEQARIPTRPYPQVPTPAELPEVYRWLKTVPGDFAVAEFPVYGRRQLRFYGYENYFSTFHWKRLFFGRPSFYPPALEYLLWTFRRFPSPEATRVLQSLGVRAVIYHPRRDSVASSQDALRRLCADRSYDELRGFGSVSGPAEAMGYGDEVVFAVLPGRMPPPRLREEAPIPSEGFRFESSSKADPRAAIDGDLFTSWSSMAPQWKGQYFDVDLGAEFWVSRISLGLVYPYSEFPRELAVNGYHTSHRWERLQLLDDPWAPARLVAHLVQDPATATMDLVLREPRKLERVRLFLQRTVLDDAMPEWRIPEVEIFQSPPREDSQ